MVIGSLNKKGLKKEKRKEKKSILILILPKTSHIHVKNQSMRKHASQSFVITCFLLSVLFFRLVNKEIEIINKINNSVRLLFRMPINQ
jgi:hypothetical protein